MSITVKQFSKFLSMKIDEAREIKNWKEYHSLMAVKHIIEDECDVDNVALKFGKWINKTPNEIAHLEPGYVVWMHDNMTMHENAVPLCTEELYEQCKPKPKPKPEQRSWLSKFWNKGYK